MDLIDIDKVLDEFEASENAKIICSKKIAHEVGNIRKGDLSRNEAAMYEEKSCILNVDQASENTVNQGDTLGNIADTAETALLQQSDYTDRIEIISDRSSTLGVGEIRISNENDVNKFITPQKTFVPDFTDRELTEEELNAYLADVDVNDAEISKIIENLATLTHADQMLDENLTYEGETSKFGDEITANENHQNSEVLQSDEIVCHKIPTIKDNGASITVEINVADFPVGASLDDTMDAGSACEVADVFTEDDRSALEENGGSLVTIKHISDEIFDPWKPTESELQLGQVEPIWIPDQDSNICMLCESKFTLIKRRHHCRACGRVLCLECCNIKRKLPYSENSRDVRICKSCNERLQKIEEYKRSFTTTVNGSDDASISESNPLPPNNDSNSQSGIENVDQSLIVDSPAYLESCLPSEAMPQNLLMNVKRCAPVLKQVGYVKDQYLAELFIAASDTQGLEIIPDRTEVDSSTVVTFALKLNLSVAVKRVCTKLRDKSQYVWSFASHGLKNVCADEIAIILAEDIPDDDEETTFTSKFFLLKPLLEEVLRFYEFFYEAALRGTLLSDMVFIDSPENLKLSLGGADNAGFLLFRPTFQCLTSLLLPEDPFLIGLLMKNNESPWAKILPLRLLLRLGLEYQSYPCPIISFPNRTSVVVDHGGSTIMNLLNDFRSFTYKITYVIRMWIMLLENDKIVISIPNDQFCTMQRIIESSNEHVLAFAASFCKIADLHLVCTQSQENGSYSSYSIDKNIEKDQDERKITGCTFVVFNVSSKTGGANFRTSIVEDGIMVQMRQEILTSIKEKLMKHENMEIRDQTTTDPVDGITNPGASIEIRWENIRKSDLKIYSSVDGRWLGDGIRFRLSGRNIEVSSKSLLVRLVSLFILPPEDEDESSPSCAQTLNDPPDDLYVIIKKISTSLATTLLTKTGDYFLENNLIRSIGVRFAYGFDTVDYSVGIDGCELSKELLSVTDDCLIPILSDSVQTTELPDAGVTRSRFCANVELMLRLLRL